MNLKTAENFGRLLNIDLNRGESFFSIFPETAVNTLGGRGFNIWYLYNNLPKGTDPLSSENILIFSCGLLTGSNAPTSARLHINALSPLTGILGSSNIGGYAGAWLRSCDIASIIITGRSQRPVYLYIDAKGVRIEDASQLLGKDAFETQNIIQHACKNKKIKILALGQGGESRIRFATIMSGRDHAAGRTGMGSVMGSKNIKAIVIEKGIYKHFPAETQSQKDAVKSYTMKIKNSPEFEFFSKHGSAGYVQWANDFGIMASKNYTETKFKNIEKLDTKTLEKNIVRSSGCFRCPVQCKAELRMSSRGKQTFFTKPEFEPVINFGPKCGLDDLIKILELDNLCGRLGIDTTSTASVIAFAMDLYDRKLLPAELAGDLDLFWGNAEAMKELIFQMVEGRGLGKILSLGVREAARIIGNGASNHAVHVKGLELTAYHPSVIMGTALGYSVSSRGGDYNNVYACLEYSWPESRAEKEFGTREAVNIKSIAAKGRLIKKAVTTNIIVDSLGLCKVPVLTLLGSFNLENEAELIKGLTLLDISDSDLLKAGQKIAALEKLFNIRHAKEDIKDQLPEMFINKDKDKGLTRQNFEIMLQEYYQEMGWDARGIPEEPLL